ncbi:MAG: hypothetical protein NZO16_06090, partial [Deltaproteobacteria bacterium]|nr:hypothetical protein [Deltaproteobacteria bacterium]
MSSTNEQEIVLSPWRPEAYLEKVDLTSSFFGRILVEEFFKPEHKVLREEFLYIFEVFKLSFQDIEISSNATNKPAGGKTFYFHCEGINAIQLSDSSIQNIEELLTGFSSNNSLILIEYLIRKLVCLSSLSELFRGAKFLSQRLIPHQHFRSSTLIRIKVSDRVIDLTLLFSDDFIKKKVSSVNLFDSNKGLERGVYLCFLMIPVAEIEEYLKSGTVIDLDIPMATRAYLRLNEREAVVGTLLNADG